MLSLAHLIISVDPYDNSAVSSHQQVLILQRISMHLLFGFPLPGDPDCDLRVFPANGNPNECQWRGIFCGNNQLVSSIDYSGKDNPAIMRFAWFPSSIRTIGINNVTVELLTDLVRSLPKNLERFTAVNCGLSGPLYFNLLPRKLEWLNLQNNNFRGPIYLIGLPQNLTRIDLKKNEINSIVGTERCLPEGLDFGRFGLQRGSNPRYRSIDGSKKDVRIVL